LIFGWVAKSKSKAPSARRATSKNVFWLLHTPPIVYGAYTRLILTLRTSFLQLYPSTISGHPSEGFAKGLLH
jgi:hypothetical protein